VAPRPPADDPPRTAEVKNEDGENKARGTHPTTCRRVPQRRPTMITCRTRLSARPASRQVRPRRPVVRGGCSRRVLDSAIGGRPDVPGLLAAVRTARPGACTGASRPGKTAPLFFTRPRPAAGHADGTVSRCRLGRPPGSAAGESVSSGRRRAAQQADAAAGQVIGASHHPLLGGPVAGSITVTIAGPASRLRTHWAGQQTVVPRARKNTTSRCDQRERERRPLGS